jgi:hypothetical protein
MLRLRLFAGAVLLAVLAWIGPGNSVALAGLPAPVADAGPDWMSPLIHEGIGYANLDGSASSDPDGSIVSWSWKEDGTEIATGEIVSVMLAQGLHLIDLTVTDNDGLTGTDQVQVEITALPLNGNRYVCPDINGDTYVNSADQLLVLKSFGKRFGQAGYARMNDYNVDRVINSIDQLGLARWFGQRCSVEQQMVRTSTLAIEQYQNINDAYADGFVQATQFVPGQGLHVVKSSRYDLTFDPAAPEGLLYEPDSSSPGGYRLAAALYVIPYGLNPLVPDGIPNTTDDAWHYHDFLCFYSNGNGGTYVTLDPESVCTANGGSYQTNVGWLLHVWNYVLDPPGMGLYSAFNANLMGLP